MIHQGRIVLGAEIKTRSVSLFDDENNDEDMEDDKMEITASALSVKWENFNENEFAIPADFVKYTNTYASDSIAAPDSILVMLDSMAMLDATKTKEVKKKATPTKQPAKPKSKVNNSKDGTKKKPD
jgi:hypothetical protein